VNIGAFEPAAEALQLAEEAVRRYPLQGTVYSQVLLQQLAQAQGESGDIDGAQKHLERLAEENERQRTISLIAGFHISAHSFPAAEQLLAKLTNEKARDYLRADIAVGYAQAGKQEAARKWLNSVTDPDIREFSQQRLASTRISPPVPIVSRARRVDGGVCGNGLLDAFQFARRVKSEPKAVHAELEAQRSTWNEAQFARRIGRALAESSHSDAQKDWRRRIPSGMALAYLFLGLAEGTAETLTRNGKRIQ
jgi:hypothetical protein